jgi:rRNA maturation endonuclease Nob1
MVRGEVRFGMRCTRCPYSSAAEVADNDKCPLCGAPLEPHTEGPPIHAHVVCPACGKSIAGMHVGPPITTCPACGASF